MLYSFIVQVAAALIFVFTSLIIGKLMENWLDEEKNKLEISNTSKKEIDTLVATVAAVKDTISLMIYKLSFDFLNKFTSFKNSKESLSVHFAGTLFGTFLFIISIGYLSEHFDDIRNLLYKKKYYK